MTHRELESENRRAQNREDVAYCSLGLLFPKCPSTGSRHLQDEPWKTRGDTIMGFQISKFNAEAETQLSSLSKRQTRTTKCKYL